MVEGVASSFGSSATSSLGSGHDGVETSSVVLDVVSISISGSGSEMIGSEFMVLSVSSELCYWSFNYHSLIAVTFKSRCTIFTSLTVKRIAL